MTNHEVILTVRCQVDSDEDINEVAAKQAACEAVANALSQVEGMGFEHSLANQVSIGIAEVSHE